MELRTRVLRKPRTSIKRVKCPTCGTDNIEFPPDIMIDPFLILFCKKHKEFVLYSAGLTATMPVYNVIVQDMPERYQTSLAVTVKTLR